MTNTFEVEALNVEYSLFSPGKDVIKCIMHNDYYIYVRKPPRTYYHEITIGDITINIEDKRYGWRQSDIIKTMRKIDEIIILQSKK